MQKKRLLLCAVLLLPRITLATEHQKIPEILLPPKISIPILANLLRDDISPAPKATEDFEND